MGDATMDCKDTRRQLLEAHDPGASVPGAEEHLASCAACRGLREQLCGLDRLVRQQTPELPQGFELSLRRRLDQATKQPRRARDEQATSPSRRRLGLALAAAAAVLITAGVFLATRGDGEVEARHHQVRIAVQSGQAIDDVRFELTLPDGVHLAASAGDALGRGKQLRWRSHLGAGLNEIELPLVSRIAGGRTVRARISHGGRTLERTVVLDASASTASRPAPKPLRLAWNLDLTPGGDRQGGQR